MGHYWPFLPLLKVACQVLELWKSGSTQALPVSLSCVDSVFMKGSRSWANTIVNETRLLASWAGHGKASVQQGGCEGALMWGHTCKGTMQQGCPEGRGYPGRLHGRVGIHVGMGRLLEGCMPQLCVCEASIRCWALQHWVVFRRHCSYQCDLIWFLVFEIPL